MAYSPSNGLNVRFWPKAAPDIQAYQLLRTSAIGESGHWRLILPNGLWVTSGFPAKADIELVLGQRGRL